MQQIVRKRNGNSQAGREPNAQALKETRDFTKKLRVVQSFRFPLVAGTNTPANISLNSPGKFLLGVSAVPVSAGDITDTAIDMSVNNYNLLTGVPLSNLNPNFVGSMMYFPTPSKLQGNDTFKISFNKSNPGNITCYLSVFYIPQ